MLKEKKYFYGKELSKEEIEKEFISLGTVASCFNHILCNEIMSVISWEDMEEVETDEHRKEVEGIEELINDLEVELQELIESEADGEKIEEVEEQIEEAERSLSELFEVPEIFQWYIVDSIGADLIKEAGNGFLWYVEKLNIYVWGVDFWGTSWSGIYTRISVK